VRGESGSVQDRRRRRRYLLLLEQRYLAVRSEDHRAVPDAGNGGPALLADKYDQALDSSTINWQSSGSNPAYQYQWPSEVGFKIVGTPVSDHSALSVTVVVSNLS